MGFYMETLDIPVLEEQEEQAPPTIFTEEEIDLAAFELWREASRPPDSEE